MKKRLDTKAITNELRGGSAFFPQLPSEQTVQQSSSETNPQGVTQNPTYVSKRSSKPLSKNVSKHVPPLPTTEDIEQLSFRLRKITKSRINGDVPEEWKVRIDDIAHELGIGKYELVMYIIGKFLGEAD